MHVTGTNAYRSAVPHKRAKNGECPQFHARGRKTVSVPNFTVSVPNFREAIYWHFPHYSNHGMQSPGGAIRAGDYKLLEYYENNTVQLFNL